MRIKHAHFIGIAGAGMSATAKLLRDKGIAITGSDEGVYPPVSEFLTRERIPYNTKYAAANIPVDADLIVIGKNAKLIPETNAEVAAAFLSGRRLASFPEVLSELTESSEVLVVAGSYGKSTSAAIIAHCLGSLSPGSGEASDPSFFIGAIPFTPSTNARMGTGKLFVLEGDEYPSSNTDQRSKFLHYHPQHLLIVPIAHDHLNVFPTSDDYLKPFEQLVEMVPSAGSVVMCLEGKLSKELLSRLARPIVTYGVHDGSYRACDIDWGETTGFTIRRDDSDIARVTTTQLGIHNIQNIVGVAAFIFSHHLMTTGQFADAIAGFRGIRRRLDRKTDRTTVPIYEGFGSSYEKARSAIAAIRQHFPTRRLIVIFEPHTFSWRNRDALHWYDDVFAGADKIFVYEPATQGATTHTQVSQKEIVDRVVGAGFDAEAISNPQDAMHKIGDALRPADVVLLLTSGNLGGLIERVALYCEEKFPG
jgi:UDP-N-acetylmuramate: L-alanyl-gamma-D-glutamyl-meso-diaminopimelate ligase